MPARSSAGRGQGLDSGVLCLHAGYVPIYVGLVTDADPEPVRIPPPRVLPGK